MRAATAIMLFCERDLKRGFKDWDENAPPGAIAQQYPVARSKRNYWPPALRGPALPFAALPSAAGHGHSPRPVQLQLFFACNYGLLL